MTACHFPLESWPMTGPRSGARRSRAGADAPRSVVPMLLGGSPPLRDPDVGGDRALTVVLSLAFGALARAPLSRSIAVGLYLVGLGHR